MNPVAATCTPIHSSRILAADLSRAVAEFSAAPPDAVIGYSPVPGSRRVFHAIDLQRLAAKFGVRLDSAREACFEWPLVPISPDEVVLSMRESLQMPEARVGIVELGTRVVPQGRIVFPLQGLTPAADRNSGPALWRGYVAYGDTRRFNLWARVKLSAMTSRVVAVASIPTGHAIEASDVRLETVDDFPIWREVARHLDEVVGRVARRSIPAGRAVLRTDLSQPFAIEAGEVVEVDVESGPAHLRMQGRAENSGRDGDMISVRNPRSGKSFRARVEGKGKVLVMPGVTGGMVN